MARAIANPLVSTVHDDQWYDRGRWWQRTSRRMYDRVAVALIGRGHPQGIRRLDWLGRCMHAAGWVPPSRRDVATLFPALTRREGGRVARESAALLVRNRAAIASMQAHGFTRLAHLVDDGCAAEPPSVLTQRSGGVILLTFHVGAQFGVAAAMTRWGLPALMLRELPLDNVDARARILKTAIDTVRAGGLVAAVADGPGGASSEPIACLGRHIVLRRGPLVIARMTGAPVVPMVARWTEDGHIVVQAGAPFAPGRPDGAEGELALAAAVANWLGQYLQAHPGDIWPYTLSNLLGAPVSPDEVGSAQEQRVSHRRS